MAATTVAVYGIMPPEPEGAPLAFVVITAEDVIELVFAPDVVPESGQKSLTEDAEYKLSVGQRREVADDPVALQDLWFYNKTVLTDHAEEHDDLDQARARAAELIEENRPYSEETAGASQ